MIAPRRYRSHKPAQRGLLLFLRHNTGKQCTAKACLAAVSIAFLLRPPALPILVKSAPYPLRQVPVTLLQFHLLQNPGYPGKRHRLQIKSAGCHQRSGRLLIQLSPLSHMGIPLQHAVHGLPFQMIHISPHHAEILPQNSLVAIFHIVIPGCHHAGPAPVGILKKTSNPEIFRRYPRHKARLLRLPVVKTFKRKARIAFRIVFHGCFPKQLLRYLRILHIIHDFRNPAADIISRRHGRKHQLRCFQPPQFFDLGTIRKAAHHVALNGTVRHPVNRIQYLLIRFKIRMLFIHQPDRTALKIFHGGNAREARHLHILKTMIAKMRMPLLASGSGHNIAVHHPALIQRIAALGTGGLIHAAAVRLQHLPRIQLNFLPRKGPGILQPQADKTRAVFPHIHQPVSAWKPDNTRGSPSFPDTYGQEFPCRQLSLGRFHDCRIPPALKLCLRRIPTLHLKRLHPIIILSAVPVLKGHRTFPCFPGFAAGRRYYHSSVLHGQLHLGKQLLVPADAVLEKNRVILLVTMLFRQGSIPFFHHRIHGKIHILPISQNHAHRILPLLQKREDIISNIIYPAVKLTLPRLKQVFGKRLSIDARRKKPQAADIEPRLFYPVPGLYRKTAHNGRRRRLISGKIIPLADPGRFPVLLLKQPHFKRGGSAPRRNVPFFIPHPCLPENLLPGRKRRAFIGNGIISFFLHFSAVPQIGPSLLKKLR